MVSSGKVFPAVNIAAIEGAGGFVDAQWIEGARAGTAEVVSGAGGLWNIAVMKPGGGALHLHSTRDPEREAARFVGGAAAWRGRHAVLYGPGCGYAVDALALRVGPRGAVTALECSPDIARAVLDNVDLLPLLSYGNVALFFGPGEKVITRAWRRIRDMESRDAGDPVARLLVHQPSLQLLPPSETAVRAFLSRLKGGCFLESLHGNIGAMRRFNTLHKKMLLEQPLDDADMALLFVENAYAEKRFVYHESLFERADPPGRAENVLIISLSSIGDVVTSSTVFAGLRDLYPRARIVFLTEQPNPVLYERCGLLDGVIGYSRGRIAGAFSGDAGIEELDRGCAAFLELLERVRAEKFDAVFNLHLSARSAILAGALDAPGRVGFFVGRDGMPLLRGNFWTRAKMLQVMPHGLIQEENNLRVLGLSPRVRDTHVRVPDDDGPGDYVWPPLLAHPARGRMVGLNPASSVVSRIWGVDKYMDLCRIMTRDMGLDVLVFGGVSEPEQQLVGMICDAAGPRATPCLGAPLDQAAWAARQCRLFVTNDTGPMHIAGAAGARCLVIGGPSNTLPYRANGHICVAANIHCFGCSPLSQCTHRQCFEMVRPAHVAFLIEIMLANNPANALKRLHGTPEDGVFPHLLLTTGVHETVAPRWHIFLRHPRPAESFMAGEFWRIAIYNVMHLLDANALKTGSHPAGIDHPGLGSPVSPERAVADIRLRYDFHECDNDELGKQVKKFIQSQSANSENGATRAAFPAIEHLCNVTGRNKDIEKANDCAHGFLSKVYQAIS